jgi:hypothetical protein
VLYHAWYRSTAVCMLMQHQGPPPLLSHCPFCHAVHGWLVACWCVRARAVYRNAQHTQDSANPLLHPVLTDRRGWVSALAMSCQACGLPRQISRPWLVSVPGVVAEFLTPANMQERKVLCMLACCWPPFSAKVWKGHMQGLVSVFVVCVASLCIVTSQSQFATPPLTQSL